jgi:hypothetical protein
MAERNIVYAHKSGDQEGLSAPGDSPLTMRMPMASNARARVATWRMVFQTDPPLFKRPPSAKGMDMPTMNRNPGNTRSTKVMPLPCLWRSLKCTIQSGVTDSGAPARSFTKIIVNITKPRRASMELTRGTGAALFGESRGMA